MVTDDERRRVAERLRGLKRNENNVTQLNHGPTWSLAWCVLGDEMDKCGAGDWFERMCERLADLIEPGESRHESGQNQDSVQKESPAVPKAPECDREALLALAEEMEGICDLLPVRRWAHSIREACGEVE